MEECKFCGSLCLRKEGIKGGTQRYRCKLCNRVQIGRDNRQKYGGEEKRIALKLYLEGCGFRRIARIMSEIFKKRFLYQTIVKWIRKLGKQLMDLQRKCEKIEELYTYVKKRVIKSEYGLLSTEIDCVLVHLSQVVAKREL
jgi:transposase-like protein